MRAFTLGRIKTIALVFVSIFSISILASPGPEFHEGPSEKEFTITSFEVAEYTEFGEKIVGTAVIQNTGTGGGTGLIEVRVGIQLIKLADVVLEPGEASPYTFRFMMPDKGVYTITISSPHDSKSGRIQLRD